MDSYVVFIKRGEDIPNTLPAHKTCLTLWMLKEFPNGLERFTQINDLYIFGTPIKHLSAVNLPPNIERIECKCCHIETVGLSGLKYLDKLLLPDNKLTKILTDDIPKELSYLDCSSNKLEYIESLPKTLKIVDLTDNRLTQLPKLPSGLLELHVRYNNIDALHYFPESLRSLSTDANIDSIIVLPFLDYITVESKYYRLYDADVFVAKKIKERICSRTRRLKEELIAVVWHPDRLERMAAALGIDVIDYMDTL